MTRRSAQLVVALVLAVSGAIAPAAVRPVAAATLPANFTDNLVASIASPTDMAFVPGGRSILVTTQPGQVRLYDPAIGNQPIVLDLSSKLCSNSERGLLGIALDPGFTNPATRYVYLYYTFRKFGVCDTNTANAPVNRVSRFTASPDLAINPASEVVLVDNIPSVAGNHNGGDLDIASDGLLYVSVGDSGCKIGDSSRCAGQNDNARFTNILAGKILRVVRFDGSIPNGNPFGSAVGGRNCGDPAGVPPGSGPCREIFATGLRNPFRIAFNPGTTQFNINDVGQNTWEEIDAGAVGADYGWNVREGHCANGSTTDCGTPPAGMTNPIFDYGRSAGCASITGGAFVPSGIGWPAEFAGAYLYADYVCGKIARLNQGPAGQWTSTDFVTGLGGSSAVTIMFGPSVIGTSLYYTSYAGGGQVRRIDYTLSNHPPTGVLSATPLSGPPPLIVDFDASGSSDPDGDTLSYHFDFGDASKIQQASPMVSHTYTAAGTYTARLDVFDGRNGVSQPVTVTIQVGNGAPTPTITSPAAGALFAVGQPVTLSGSAMDPEQGTLPASALSWTVIKHHATHTHPFLGPVTGNDITFTAPAPEDLLAATNSYLEIRLTATDANGASTTATRDFMPRKVNLTFATNPSGLAVTVNGQSFSGPSTITSWQSWSLNVSAATQVSGGRTFRFQSWSDGGAASHTIVTPAAPTTYTAKFKRGGKG
jgi:glucose/arabinose dehydrogenase/PKD repeat protein